MISIEKEQQIRAHLKAGLSGPKIARLVKTGDGVVYAIRKMVEDIAKMTDDQLKGTKNLLQQGGICISTIEKQMNIPRAWILAVQRYYYLHPARFKRQTEGICPTCGAAKIENELYTGERLDGDVVCQLVDRDNMKAMYRVIEDLVGLGNCGLSISPLIYNLVLNSIAIIEKINAQKRTADYRKRISD